MAVYLNEKKDFATRLTNAKISFSSLLFLVDCFILQIIVTKGARPLKSIRRAWSI